MVSCVALSVFLFSFFLSAFSQSFVSLVNFTSTDATHFATVQSKTGVVKVVGESVNDGKFQGFSMVSYDSQNEIFAVSCFNSSDPLVYWPAMQYTFMKAGVPSVTYRVGFKFPVNSVILDHAFQPSENRSIIVVAPNGNNLAPNLTIWSVDMNDTSFETTLLFEIALDGIVFPEYPGMDIDGDELFLLAYATTNSSSGFLSFSLETGKLQGQMFDPVFSTFFRLAHSGQMLYGVGSNNVASFNLETKEFSTIASSWCRTSSLMFYENCGFNLEDDTAFVLMDCGGDSTLYMFDLATGKNLTVVNNDMANVFGLRPLL